MTMLREIGKPNFPIWLLGDSNPKNWADALATPLDPRHPARHNIWTPIIDVIQDRVYRQAKLRVDTSSLYIRNAIEDPTNKPAGNNIEWSMRVIAETDALSSSLTECRPAFLFSFGAFAYEFARRGLGELPEHPHGYWGARNMGEQFLYRAAHFDPNKINVFPLLHATIARGRFLESHRDFCDQPGANYFEYVGSHLVEIMLINKDRLNIWI
jgi:hypothetical protein